MATGTTKIQNLVNPQVMADAVTAKVKQKIVATPFAKVDDTLVANAGDTITIPTFEYIGDAEDVANAALYLASDMSKFVTGQVLRVDGGLNL